MPDWVDLSAYPLGRVRFPSDGAFRASHSGGKPNVADLEGQRSRQSVEAGKALRKIYGQKSIVLEGQQFTGQSLADRCAKQVDADAAVEQANRMWRDAVAKRDAMREENASLFQGLHRLLQATYGKDSQMIAEFGFKPAERFEKSAEVKAAAVVKLRATRAARHTMGKRQKEGVKGAPSPTPGPVPRIAS